MSKYTFYHLCLSIISQTRLTCISHASLDVMVHWLCLNVPPSMINQSLSLLTSCYCMNRTWSLSPLHRWIISLIWNAAISKVQVNILSRILMFSVKYSYVFCQVFLCFLSSTVFLFFLSSVFGLFLLLFGNCRQLLLFDKFLFLCTFRSGLFCCKFSFSPHHWLSVLKPQAMLNLPHSYEWWRNRLGLFLTMYTTGLTLK